MRPLLVALLAALSCTVGLPAQQVDGREWPEFDDRPAAALEWGFRPADGATVEVNPPAFSWRPQESASWYQVQLSRHASFQEQSIHEHHPHATRGEAPWTALCLPKPLAAGRWYWRVRAHRHDDATPPTHYSKARSFVVPENAPTFALPSRRELLDRIPEHHPRLFVRPEHRAPLRAAAEGNLQATTEALLARCRHALEHPSPTDEPPKYPAGTVRGSDPWREIWWGNRRRTIAVLEPAADLAFAWWLWGDESCRDAAKQRLLAAAEWDPRGATSYAYNDEAGMPYAYHFARTYTFLHDALTAGERARCREVLTVRGREMHAHLCPNHLWKPYSSHSNRAWHFLGELGIALHGEVEEADDWTWFAANVFTAVYPVWSDADGGWHEGTAYWRSYLGRFTWWADVMREALGIDAYQQPFFSRVGDFALYTMPPGTRGGGFGDLSGRLDSQGGAALVGLFAQQADNPHWQWYADTHVARQGSGFIDFLRAARGAPEARPPADLPSSKLFAGTGVAALNSNLLDGTDNVGVRFKSSPFGSQSHGYEAQNAFLLQAYGERLLIRSGRRDSYGSDHHRGWMWSTRSVNSLTVDGEGQVPHSATATGAITRFQTTPHLDVVTGDATAAYAGKLELFERTLVFAKPDLLLVLDSVRAAEPKRWTWWFHAEQAFELDPDHHAARLEVGGAAAMFRFLGPADLDLAQTDRFDPPPRPRVQLVEHHLTVTPHERLAALHLVTAIDVARSGSLEAARLVPTRTSTGLRVEAELPDGRRLEVVRPETGRLRAVLRAVDGHVLAEI